MAFADPALILGVGNVAYARIWRLIPLAWAGEETLVAKKALQYEVIHRWKDGGLVVNVAVFTGLDPRRKRNRKGVSHRFHDSLDARESFNVLVWPGFDPLRDIPFVLSRESGVLTQVNGEETARASQGFPQPMDNLRGQPRTGQIEMGQVRVKLDLLTNQLQDPLLLTVSRWCLGNPISRNVDRL